CWLRADRVARNVLEQRLTALPAVDRATAVRRSTGGAGARRSGLLHAQDALDLAELGIDVLEDRRAAHQHLDPDVVADRHLIDGTAQVTLQLGEARRQLIPTS